MTYVLTGDIRVLQGSNYINPVNLSFLRDDNRETCTTFEADGRLETRQLTTFRVRSYDQRAEYINVTLVGQNLSCSDNLYVMPLTAAQTKHWTGIWITCPLLTTSVEGRFESCTFNCRCLGGCAEIQISKRPRKASESSWSLCRLDIGDRSAGIRIWGYCLRFATCFVQLEVPLW